MNDLVAYLTWLKAEQPQRFDLSVWGPREELGLHTQLEVAEQWEEARDKGKLLPCGTAACLVGHLPLAFPDGWCYMEVPVSTQGPFPTEVRAYMKCGTSGMAVATLTTCLSWFFGGNGSDWTSIIYPDSYASVIVSIDEVLNRLEELQMKIDKYWEDYDGR